VKSVVRFHDALIMHSLTAYRILQPPTGLKRKFKYGGKATATDLLHHAVYATATGLAYSYLNRGQSR
jgi:hypothetical protein